MNKLDNIIAEILPEVIEFRHTLHKNPELSGVEFNTAKLIRQKLAEIGLECEKPFLETDVITSLKGRDAKKTIVLRADMDALKQIETNQELKYCSQNGGVMHACGHDGHMAILYGAILVLKRLEKSLNGVVKFVFQPGEEVGALGQKLLKNGAIDNPKPDLILALHGFNGFPAGKIISKAGVITAANNSFSLKVIGKGGHSSKPHECVDPIVIASNIINSWQTIISRNINPLDNAVLSIGKICGGNAWNSIADSVEISGSVRYFDKKFENFFPEKMELIAKNITESMGGKIEFEYNKYYIPTVNSLEAFNFIKTIAADDFIELKEALTIGEDFSFYLDKYNGAFALLGLGEDYANLHSNTFDFNDEVLKNGIRFFCQSVIKFLQKGKTNNEF